MEIVKPIAVKAYGDLLERLEKIAIEKDRLDKEKEWRKRGECHIDIIDEVCVTGVKIWTGFLFGGATSQAMGFFKTFETTRQSFNLVK